MRTQTCLLHLPRVRPQGVRMSNQASTIQLTPLTLYHPTVITLSFLIGLLIGALLHRISRLAPFIVPDKYSHAPVPGCHVLDVSLSSFIPVSGVPFSGVDVPCVSFPTVPDRILAPAPGHHVLDVFFSSITVSGVPVSGVDVPDVSFPTVPDRILAPAPSTTSSTFSFLPSSFLASQ